MMMMMTTTTTTKQTEKKQKNLNDECRADIMNSITFLFNQI